MLLPRPSYHRDFLLGTRFDTSAPVAYNEATFRCENETMIFVLVGQTKQSLPNLRGYCNRLQNRNSAP
jgi:hypothetical protein